MLRGALQLFTAQIFRLVTQTLYFVLIARGLGAVDFGKVTALISVFTALLPLTLMGCHILAIRVLARHPERRRAIWGLGLLVTVGLGTLASLILALVAPGLLGFAFPRLALFLFAAGELVLFGIMVLVNGILQGSERLDRIARALAGLALARLVVMAATQLVWGLDPLRFSLAYFVGTLIPVVWILAAWVRPWGRPALPAGLAEASRSLRDGLTFSLSSVGRGLLLGFDKMMLPGMAGLPAAAQYGAGFRILSVAYLPLQALLTALYPRFFRRGGESFTAGLGVWRRAAPLAITYGAGAALLMWLLAPLVLPLLGDEYAAAPAALRALAWLIILQALYAPLGDALSGADHIVYRSAAILGAAGVNLGLNLWLIPRHGWRGAVVAAYVSHGLLLLLYALRAWVLARSERREAADA